MAQFLKDLSIRIKILVPVGLLGVMMICVGVMGIVSATNIMHESNEISENYITGLEYEGEMAGNYQSLRRVAFAHIVASNSGNTELMQKLEEEGKGLREQIESTVASYEKITRVDVQEQAVAKFGTDFAAYMEVWDSILSLSGQGKIDDASNMANTELREKGTAITESLTTLKESLEQGVKIATDSQERTFKNSRLLIYIFIGIGVLVLAFTAWVSWVWCCKRLININKQLREIIKSIEEGRGDLTKRVQCFCVDEIATLSAGINVFIETLHKIMGQINSSSTQLGSIVNLVSEKVDTANSNSGDISSVMENLSASMEEISSTVVDIRASVETVDHNVIELADESQGLYDYANEMQNRAEELERGAAEKSRNTTEVVNGIVESLKIAIEDSKSVEKVNSLTDEILSIASQTNLLSLNASIEAARAGEAGRGFAVVADEISQLANSSREAAGNIQNINNMVVKAVNELIQSSDNMVKYINENILPDYENFVKTGRQYSDDAIRVNETVARFNDMSANLKQLVQNITNAVVEISSAVDESANGVTNAAMNTSDLAKGIGEIATAMSDNKEVAGTLEEEADRFINLDVEV